MAVPCPPTASASFTPLRLLWIFMFTWSAQPGNEAVNCGLWAGHSEREDRVREMSRRLASGRRQHSEHLQRNTGPIKDRHSISKARKGIPPCLPPSLVYAIFTEQKTENDATGNQHITLIHGKKSGSSQEWVIFFHWASSNVHWSFFFFLLFLFFNCNIDYVQNYVSYRYIEQWFTIFKVFALLIVTIKYWLYCLCCIKYPFRLIII